MPLKGSATIIAISPESRVSIIFRVPVELILEIRADSCIRIELFLNVKCSGRIVFIRTSLLPDSDHAE